jgi:hypothetical protein
MMPELTDHSLHITMFGALLILAASVLFLVENDKIPSDDAEDVSDAEAIVKKETNRALWAASASLALTLLTMTCVALLNRSLDKPGTLVISSRWVRLAPRGPAIVLIMCLPLFHISGSTWCGTACLIVYAEFLWEWFGGLEKDWKWLEPKYEAE